MKRAFVLIAFLVAGCGVHSAPAYVTLSSLTGVYVSQVPQADVAAISIAASQPNMNTFTGYTYSTLADAQAAVSAGITSDAAKIAATGVVSGVILYTDSEAPHVNNLTFAVQFCPGLKTCLEPNAPMYSGRAHLDSLGNLIESRENYSTQTQDAVVWQRQ